VKEEGLETTAVDKKLAPGQEAQKSSEKGGRNANGGCNENLSTRTIIQKIVEGFYVVPQIVVKLVSNLFLGRSTALVIEVP